MLNAWTGPSNSSFNALFTRRCLAIGVLESNREEMTITLKCVSDPVGLYFHGA